MSVKSQNSGFSFIGLIKKVFLIDLIQGLSITFKYNIGRTISLRYPDEEKWIPHQRFRGALTLNKDTKGRELCVACELCSRACPTDCITVVPMEDDDGKGITDRIARVWRWDSVRCLYCGYCQDACPTTAVRLGRDYELACFDLADTIKQKDDLMKPQEFPEDVEGGYVVKAKLHRYKDGSIKVIPDINGKKKLRRV